MSDLRTFSKKVVDFLKNKIKVFGPNKFASKLEAQKLLENFKKNNIPTANYKFVKQTSSFKFLKTVDFSSCKADGLQQARV